jgi:Fe-S cluster assembly protein SufD
MTVATDTAWFEAAHAALSARDGASWVQAIRERGLARFAALGLPTTRLEDWKSTSVAALAKIPFAPPEPSSGSAAIAEEWLAHVGPGPRLVLVNGRCIPELSRGVTDGVRLRGLACAIGEERGLLEEHLDALASGLESAFVALNAALLEDGAFVHVPRGVTIEAPIHVLHVTSGRGETLGMHPRTVVVLEEGSRATLVESHVGHEGQTLTNAVTEIRLAAGARLDHVHAQRQSPAAFHLASTIATVARDATFRTSSIAFGARLSRQELTVVMAGEGAASRLDGLAFLAGAQHADHHVFVDHASPHASSEQLYKYACAGRSRGVFRGRIRVREQAQDTSAHQQSRNLLLSDEALVDSMPQLEISADDVRCTHGATIGQLDPELVLYLRARGIDEAAARHLLVRAFAGEMIERLPDAHLREELAHVLDAKQIAVEGA